jgi:hypothetical protein
VVWVVLPTFLAAKGAQNIGGGMKVITFVLKLASTSTGVTNSYTNHRKTNSSAIFGRQSWVGLSGGFGEVHMAKCEDFGRSSGGGLQLRVSAGHALRHLQRVKQRPPFYSQIAG